MAIKNTLEGRKTAHMLIKGMWPKHLLSAVE